MRRSSLTANPHDDAPADTLGSISEPETSEVNSPARRDKSASLFVRTVLYGLTISIGYVLSIGPMGVAAKALGYDHNPMIRTFYAPVIWLHDHTFLRKPLEYYVSWFGLK